MVADYSEEHFALGTPKLADVLKLRMHEMGLTQANLAKLLGVSPSRVSEYLTGKSEPTLKVCRDSRARLFINHRAIFSSLEIENSLKQFEL